MSRLARGEHGQASVELALALALVLLPLLVSLLEFGYLFSQAQTVSTATREGARTGGNLANGGQPLGCGAGQSPGAASVDPQIVAAVERALTANGALVTLADVSEIRIFKATATGAETPGVVNVWTYSLNGGPTIDGQPIDFVQQSIGWQACSRLNTLPADSLGVTLRYTYRARTPLRYVFAGLAVLNLSDTTVMTLNATN
ncbi:MAG TPA: TadE/TadG family type IV pilus assembly protein [Candidatus Acidoferrales bacterium]|nr:TadE/TadG family type IV pilus assembly protein [Candidatus Acidoferrales bacterium]